MQLNIMRETEDKIRDGRREGMGARRFTVLVVVAGEEDEDEQEAAQHLHHHTRTFIKA